jgi:hypothetical protein
MSEILGMAGSIAGGAMNASAIRGATEAQIAALTRARDFVYNELAPSRVSGEAVAADVQRAKDRLALQAMIDPSLSQLRFDASGKLLQQVGQIGQGVEQQLAQQAAAEAMASGAGNVDLRNKLIDAAMAELDAGASLPPELQAELVQSGLEKAGMVTGAASPKGIGGTLLRKTIGSEAIKLQGERQARAAALSQAASSLEAQRQSILGTLFPNLNSMKLSNIGATAGALGTSNQMVPEAGLGGNDIANIWLARVGATNQLNQSAADVAARGTMGLAQNNANMLGAATGYLSSALPSTGSAYNTVRGWFSSPRSSGDYLGET